ncbi:MAG TPA: NosD domain-containing protein [Humibacter sp.]|nr:NosD domain-containing protein [Humibacter sp.]
MRPTWFAGGAVVVALTGLATGWLVLAAPESATAASTTVTVSSGGDIDQAIAQAKDGDTVFLRPGTYRGPVHVDKPITLSSAQSTIAAPTGGAAVTVTADGVTIDSVTTTCRAGSADELGVHVMADHVRIVDSSMLDCSKGVVLDRAQDAYLQGDALLGSRSPDRTSAGVWAKRADGLTMLGNMFEDDDIGVLVDSTSAPALDSNTFSGVGTGIVLRAVTNAIVNGTLASNVKGPAVTITGSRGAEIATLNRSGDGGGAAAAIEVTGAAGPSSVINVEDSNLSGFATGLAIAPNSLSGPVTVIGTSFAGVTSSAITVSAGSRGAVDAALGDDFGGCGPRAPDHGYDGGGALITDPDRIVAFQRRNCSAPSATPSSTAPAQNSTSSPSVAGPGSSGGGSDGTNVGDGRAAPNIPAAIGSALVTVGVTILLIACAVGVLYAIRRSRNAH